MNVELPVTLNDRKNSAEIRPLPYVARELLSAWRMSNGGLSDDVRQFIRQYVTSIEQLEILIHLYRISPKAENADSIAQALYLSPESTKRQLQHYHELHVVDSQDMNGLYGISNKQGPIGRQIAAVEAAYRERRVSVINEIYSNPISTLQSFADAFIIGKKKE